MDAEWYGVKHMDKPSGKRLVETWNDLFKHMILSVPLSDNKPYDSRGHNNNPFELHKSFWKHKEVSDLAKWELDMEIKQINVLL